MFVSSWYYFFSQVVMSIHAGIFITTLHNKDKHEPKYIFYILLLNYSLIYFSKPRGERGSLIKYYRWSSKQKQDVWYGRWLNVGNDYLLRIRLGSPINLGIFRYISYLSHLNLSGFSTPWKVWFQQKRKIYNPNLQYKCYYKLQTSNIIIIWV